MRGDLLLIVLMAGLICGACGLLLYETLKALDAWREDE